MNFFLVTLFAFFLAVQASPLVLAPRNKLDVFTPVITSPTGSTIWCIGETEPVEWETDNAPVNISNGASILLDTPPDNLHSQVLARDFDLRSGMQEVIVPKNITTGYYQITLFGDSGDKSDLFLITLCVPSKA